MRTRVKKLLDFYKQPRKYGIFYYMSQNSDFTNLFTKLGLTDNDHIHSIDFDYMFNHSGLKTISVMLEQIMYNYVVDDDGIHVITPENRKVTWDYVLLEIDQELINHVIKIKFLDKWNNLADTLTLDYDPLNPFSMNVTEKMEGNLSSTGSHSNERNTSNSGTDGNTLDSTINSKGKSNSDSNIFGFNSVESSPTDIVNNSNDTASTNHSTNKNSYDGEENSTYSSSEEYSRNNNIEHTTTRSGNIGNLSAQQLIEQQRELLRYQIFDTIYADLDSVLTRSKYY